MGQNKALLRVTPGGPSIVEMVAARLSEVASETLVVGAETEPYKFLGLRHVRDVYPNAGSLGGIYSGLQAASFPYVLVVACDMPFLNANLLRYMVSVPREYDVLIPVIDEPEPMHAIYSRRCLPWMEEKLEAGRYKIIGWFANANVQTIERYLIERYDPEHRSFFNMNTPEEWQRAREIALHG
jgi:molybdopterin-guanine dinucleotide biosynthesis protein A